MFSQHVTYKLQQSLQQTLMNKFLIAVTFQLRVEYELIRYNVYRRVEYTCFQRDKQIDW